jgi:hypothetical protein
MSSYVPYGAASYAAPVWSLSSRLMVSTLVSGWPINRPEKLHLPVRLNLKNPERSGSTPAYLLVTAPRNKLRKRWLPPTIPEPP